jgi:hypothetical protein
MDRCAGKLHGLDDYRFESRRRDLAGNFFLHQHFVIGHVHIDAAGLYDPARLHDPALRSINTASLAHSRV